jgi:hypothetical protein
VREAQLALVAEVDEVLEDPLRELVGLAVHFGDVETLEEDLERRAQGKTAPAPVADVRDAGELGGERGRVFHGDRSSNGAHQISLLSDSEEESDSDEDFLEG